MALYGNLSTNTLLGGAATGSVMDVGSNSYGRYLKFADGTMFQWGRVSFSFTGATTTSVQLTFPTSFYDDGNQSGSSTAYSVSGYGSTSHGDGNAATITVARLEDGSGQTTNMSGIRLIGRTLLAASYGQVWAWQAIGRWKA
jgi:hypothetical protein